MAGRAALLLAAVLLAAQPGSTLVTQHRLTVRLDDGLLAPDADACRLVADAEVNQPHLFNEARISIFIDRRPIYMSDLNFRAK